MGIKFDMGTAKQVECSEAFSNSVAAIAPIERESAHTSNVVTPYISNLGNVPVSQYNQEKSSMVSVVVALSLLLALGFFIVQKAKFKVNGLTKEEGRRNFIVGLFEICNEVRSDETGSRGRCCSSGCCKFILNQDLRTKNNEIKYEKGTLWHKVAVKGVTEDLFAYDVQKKELRLVFSASDHICEINEILELAFKENYNKKIVKYEFYRNIPSLDNEEEISEDQQEKLEDENTEKKEQKDEDTNIDVEEKEVESAKSSVKDIESHDNVE